MLGIRGFKVEDPLPKGIQYFFNGSFITQNCLQMFGFHVSSNMFQSRLGFVLVGNHKTKKTNLIKFDQHHTFDQICFFRCLCIFFLNAVLFVLVGNCNSHGWQGIFTDSLLARGWFQNVSCKISCVSNEIMFVFGGLTASQKGLGPNFNPVGGS